MTPYPDCVPLDLAQKFETLALEVIAAGLKRYSARAILHRIRWFHQVERGDYDFKCNNNTTPALSRWFMEKYPEHAGFFETRESPDFLTWAAGGGSISEGADAT